MAISVQTHMCTPALGEFGSDELRERYLRPAIAGEKIGAIAITEPDAGSDVAGITTRAVRDGDSWLINGRKMFITNGIRADFLTLVAQTEPGSGHRGISLFIVDTATAGRLGVAQARRSSGCSRATPRRSRSTTWSCPHAQPDRDRDRSGLRAADVAAPVRAALGCGRFDRHVAQEILEQTIAYARERRAFGDRSRTTR